MQGVEFFRHFSKEDNFKARQLSLEALSLDPKFVSPYVLLAWTHWIDTRFGFSKDRSESFKLTVKYTMKAIELDDTVADAHALLGSISLIQRKYQQAIEEGERAVDLNPNWADNVALLAMTLNYAGEPERALAVIKKAIRLSPFYPNWYDTILGEAYSYTDKYEKAIESFKRRIKRGRHGSVTYAHLAIAYSHSGREEEARAQVNEILRKNPEYSTVTYKKARFDKDGARLERDLMALRKAGLK